jgi:hypothetical protein
VREPFAVGRRFATLVLRRRQLPAAALQCGRGAARPVSLVDGVEVGGAEARWHQSFLIESVFKGRYTMIRSAVRDSQWRGLNSVLITLRSAELTAGPRDDFPLAEREEYTNRARAVVQGTTALPGQEL